MSDELQVPCGREWWGVDENGYRGRFICSDPQRRCPNCTELLAIRRRVAELEDKLKNVGGMPKITDAGMAQLSREGLEAIIRNIESRWNQTMVLWADLLGCEPNGPSLDIAVARLADAKARVAELEEAQDELMGLCDSMLQYVPTFEQRTEIRKVLGKRADRARMEDAEVTGSKPSAK